MTGADEDTMRPQLVPAAPVFLASEHATDDTGVTLAIAGGDLAIVSERERTRSKNSETDGAWTAAEIDDHWAELTDGIDTTGTTPGH